MFGCWISLATIALAQAPTGHSDGRDEYDPSDKLAIRPQHSKAAVQQLDVDIRLADYRWYYRDDIGKGRDLKAQKVWAMNITGRGVTVAIVDDGVMVDHPDLKDNYSPQASYDFIDSDSDASPGTPQNSHGTWCAGVVAAGNKECGAGIAYHARFSSIRMQGRPTTPSTLGKALTYRNDINDIYSCSWTNGNTTKDFALLSGDISSALKLGAEAGRRGKGSVYVFAAGNSHQEGGACSFSGLVNDIHTIAVGAIDRRGRHAAYSETCAGLLISADGTLFTTDTQLMPDSDMEFLGIAGPKRCTARVDGTSVAAAIVSGVLALLLEKHPGLTWRDVQHVLVKSAVPVQPSHPSWEPTFAGRNHSTHFGFGRIDALQLITTANAHVPVKPAVAESFVEYLPKEIPVGGVQTCLRIDSAIVLLEHVTVTLYIHDFARKQLTISLKSPNNVVSPLVSPRQAELDTSAFGSLEVLTLKHWDEPPNGEWCLTASGPSPGGYVLMWNLGLHGVPRA